MSLAKIDPIEAQTGDVISYVHPTDRQVLNAVVLLAAAASPLTQPEASTVDNRGLGRWYRTDMPWGSCPLPPVAAEVQQLLARGLVELTPSGARITDAGLVQAQAIRHVLGRRRRKVLAAIDAASELVRRERETTEEEYCEILASGGAPTETLVEWVRPHRGRAAKPLPGPWGKCTPAAAVPICSGSELQDLVDRGLVVLLTGGTRAVLSGAGRWCADDELLELISSGEGGV